MSRSDPWKVARHGVSGKLPPEKKFVPAGTKGQAGSYTTHCTWWRPVSVGARLCLPMYRETSRSAHVWDSCTKHGGSGFVRLRLVLAHTLLRQRLRRGRQPRSVGDTIRRARIFFGVALCWIGTIELLASQQEKGDGIMNALFLTAFQDPWCANIAI